MHVLKKNFFLITATLKFCLYSLSTHLVGVYSFEDWSNEDQLKTDNSDWSKTFYTFIKTYKFSN